MSSLQQSAQHQTKKTNRGFGMADHKKKKISKKVIIIGVIIIIAIIAVAVASQGAGGKVNPKLREVETTRQDIVTYFNFSEI